LSSVFIVWQSLAGGLKNSFVV